MNTDVEKAQTPAVTKLTKQGQFKTMQELARHKYHEFNKLLEKALKDHPHFQKKAE